MNMIHLPKVQRVTIIRTETASPKINPYTVYVIDVKLAGLNNHTVIRRYSEFMALYDKLQEMYPNVKLYFPPKKAFGKLRAEVITQRKDQLQTFLNSICEHPKISSDFSVFCFLAPQLFPSGNKKEVPVAVSLITLPNELFLKCLLMISFKDVLALTEVCTHLFHYITTHPTLWLYLNARFDVSVVGAAKLVENPHATPQTPPKRTSILSKSTQLFKSSSPSPSPPPASAAVSVPSSGREPIQHSKSFSSFSTSLPNSQFAAFSLDNPNVSNLTTSSELVKTLIDTDSPKSIRRSGSQNQLRGSMMMRPHVVPSFHIRNGPSPTEFVYMGASESEYRKMFLQHMREFHKLRVNIARENKYCDCVLRKLVGTIIGDHGVGKTKLLQSCLTSFSPSLTLPSSPHLQSTNSSEREGNAGITPQASLESNTTDCHVTHILSNGKFLCFQLFDTTGENVDFERYQHLSQSNFVLVTFSVLDRASFLRVKEKWIPEVREYSPEIPLVVVGLKRDLREDPSIMCKPVQFQEAMETFYKLGAIHYAESPSPSEGVGGWRTDFQSWRVNLLSEIGSMILFNVNPHTRPTKSAYEEKLAFLHKLFPFKQIEAIGVALASCVGDMDQAVEFLVNQGPAPPAPAPAPTMPPNFIRTGDGKILSPRSPPEENDEWRQELRQSWKMEISRMDGPKRSQLINESVEAGLVVASGTWDDEEVENSPNNTPKKEKEKDTTASTAMKAKRAVYLDKLKKTSIDRFIKDFLKRKIPAKQQAEMTVSFLGEISSYVSSHTLWEDEDEKELQKMRDELERYVFSKIYKSVFGVSQEDTTKDKFFKERISKLVFITPAHLDISDKFWNTDLWDAAVYEINQIDKYQTPSDKLTCILNCCKVIIFLLTSSGDSQAGADDFLPHLIYVLIKANPPHLASNMEFIANYCGPEAMRMEKYYYFTTMSVGTSFIENIDASSLNIDPIAFEKLMNENT